MNTKLNQFIKRNRKRNAHLYVDGLTEGHDYVVCPISNERMSMIKISYVEKILGMSIDQFDNLYPTLQKISKKRTENIKTGLHQIDLTTGLSKYEVGQQKARHALKQTDDDGLTGYKKKGQKTRATHMNNVDSLGRNGYSQIATTAIIKGNTTKANKGIISLNRDEFKRYKTIILYLTEKYRSELSNGYITGLAGVSGAWHLDHKFSILKGFQNKISPFVIGHKNNLQMLPWEKNLSKHANCSVNMEELLQNCGYTKEDSIAEFNKVQQLIISDIQNDVPPNAAFLIERLHESILRK